MKCQNPFAFRPCQVTFWTTVVYLALGISLIFVHETVPEPPRTDSSGLNGINITQGWLDLQDISKAFHPFNSHHNDDVRDFILKRAREILESNGVSYQTEILTESALPVRSTRESDLETSASTAATIFDDRSANYTANSVFGRKQGLYFEGNNAYIYIRGWEDPEGDWWLTEKKRDLANRTGGVLVNCHFDSVSTGYGATDDGMGCVTLLQLLSYFTVQGRQPRNGIVLLFNNAEEDGLLGALAFTRSPLMDFCHTLVNLEGAAAGGRALLFRTSDLQAAEAYRRAPHPFGSVIAANAFDRGVLGSQTDYKVFVDQFGMRGLDIAFYRPRARYHTEEDDARHTSRASIWHMLSAALAATRSLSETTSTVFNGDRADKDTALVQNGKGTEAVWFDIFGSAWVTFPLRGLFAWSLTLLVATPLILVVVTYLVIRYDKYYFFSGDVSVHSEVNDDPVRLGGWKGLFRFPVAFVFASALTIGSALLVAKVNPLIVYSSSYAVWTMTVSLFYFSFWLIMRGASFVRPSALHRGFVIVWLFFLGWAAQVLAALAEDRWNIAAGYSTVFLQSGVFLSLLISVLELFALPGKHDFAWQLHDAHQARDYRDRHEDDSRGPSHGREDGANDDGDNDESSSPTETTPLRASEPGYGANDGENSRTTFASGYRRSVSENPPESNARHPSQPYAQEQSWSGLLPKWTWFLQLLLLAPVPIILIGNMGLTASTALSQVATDSGRPLLPLLIPACFTILILLPLSPFIHRVTHHVPVFLLLVFIGTFIYNLVAFPFSTNHRMKFSFLQTVDLDAGTNIVTLTGWEDYIRPVINSLPSAASHSISCDGLPDNSKLSRCHYDAAEFPDVANGKNIKSLMKVTVPLNTPNTLLIDALNTRVCLLSTSRPIFGFSVEGGEAADSRLGDFPTDGFSNIALFRRDWEGAWNVSLILTDETKSIGGTDDPHQDGQDVIPYDELKVRDVSTTAQDGPLEVTVACQWSDINEADNIPAIQELHRYMPTWAIYTKAGVGLVQVTKKYQML